MMEPLTAGSIALGWKLLGKLYDEYNGWSVRKLKSKEAKAKLARAELLMQRINRSILLGSNSSDHDVRDLIDEFNSLIAGDTKPLGYERTLTWISRANQKKPVKKAAKKRMAKKVAKKRPAKKAAKKAAKKRSAKRAAKRAAKK